MKITEVKTTVSSRFALDRLEKFALVTRVTTYRKEEVLQRDGNWAEMEGYDLIDDAMKLDIEKD